MILKIIEILILTVLSATGYRWGGSSNGKRWIRPIAVSIAVTGTLLIMFGFNWWTLLCLGGGFLETTYFKRKGADAKWWNWALVGLVFALVPLPFVIASGHHWLGFAIRSAIIIPSTVLICQAVGDVDWEEGLRGGIQIVTLPLLLI